nr:Cna B-type domain-containing protein [Clostridia bacterium]
MNKSSRLTALLLALLMLMNSVAFADSVDGIPIDDLDWSTYENIFQSASQANGNSDDADDSADDYDTLSYPCEVMPEYCLFDHYSTMTATQMHEYFTEMYYEDGDGEISVRYGQVMIHYGEYHLDSGLICECGVHPMPEVTVGDITEHELDCPWHFANLSVAEQSEIMHQLGLDEQTKYVATLSEAQTAALIKYMSPRAADVCGVGNTYCMMVTTLAQMETAQERYDYLMELVATEYSMFIWHYLDNHYDDGIICNCDFDWNSIPTVFAPGSDEHRYETCPWHKDNLPGSEEEAGEIVESVGGTSVTVSGNIPDSVTMELSEASVSEAAQHLPGLSSIAAPVVALDITLMDGDAIWQPGSGESVSVTVSADELGEDGDKVLVYHIHEENGVTTTEKLGLYTIKDGQLSFSIDGFSTVLLVNCSDESGCFVNMFAQMRTSTERYNYLIDMYEKERTWYDTFMAHYEAEHIELNIICLCETPLIAPGSFYHDIDCPWHPNNDDYTFGSVEQNGIEITGKFPSNVDCDTEKVTNPDHLLVYQEIKDSLNPYQIYSVTLFAYNGNNEKESWQPTSSVKVTIDADGLGEPGDYVILYHVHVNGDDQELEILGPSVIKEDGTVTFTVTRFSYLLFVGLGPIDLGEVGGGYKEGTTFVPVDHPTYSETSNESLTNAAGEVELSMAQSGKLTLTVGSGNGKWQALFGETWVDIAGETGASMDVTYAKISSLYALNGAAKIRWISADGETVSQTAVISIKDEADPASVQPMMAAYSTRDVAIVADDDTADRHTYTVVVNFLYENRTVAWEPWKATVAAGTALNAQIIFPTIQGYEAYQENDNLPTTQYDLNIPSVDADRVLNIIYKPALVNYTVIHLQQNVNDDNYTREDVETKQALTGSFVAEGTNPDVAKSYPGFYNLLYAKPEVAADGSTVVEVKYDRYYYLMNFSLGGGYGVEPIYARYGSAIGDVGTPVRPGYVFLGWSLDGTTVVEVAETMPAGNTTYIALWQAEATATVTVVFWGENADDEGYSHIKSAEVQIAPGTSFTYSESGSLICGVTELHTHSASCGYKCGKEEHAHNFADDCYVLTCTNNSTHSHVNEGCTLQCSHGNAHTLDCYKNSENRSWTKLNSAPDNVTNQGNGIYTRRSNNHTYYYVKIGNDWYGSSSNVSQNYVGYYQITLNCNHSHTDACYTCGKAEGTHAHTVEGGCYSVKCTKELHEHDTACYACGKSEHQHSESCYMANAGMDGNLWKFVRSETVTVEADGSTKVNVYYDRVEKTLTYNYNYSNNKYNKTQVITAKWGANIADQYLAIADDAGSTFWSAQSSGNSPYTNAFVVMPQNSATYYNRGRTGSTGSMLYYGESLDGSFSIELFRVDGVGGYTVSKEDYYEFEGFTFRQSGSTSTGSSCSGAKFYYTRNSYNLTFNDGKEDIDTVSVKYEMPLGNYDFTPDAPDIYEPGSVRFAGWYLNAECTGDEYVLSEHTMPADNVLLYAKWVPVERTVDFYLDRKEYEAGVSSITATHPQQTVLHGEFAEDVAKPTNGEYEFVAWFYIDENGNEKAFSFADMPVTRDLKVYAKWTSNKLMEYTINFAIKTATGDVLIAESITNSAPAGTSLTFEAKGGTELYEGYQQGYFPEVKSHTLVVDIEDESKNIFTFYYVQVDAVPYTVHYVTDYADATDALGTITVNGKTYKKLVASKEVNDNVQAIVTETQVVVNGYMADAYQKRLVLSTTDPNSNVIIFYYEKNETSAYYKITHYIEVSTTENGQPIWVEYASSQVPGLIGQTYTGTPLTDIDGYEYNAEISKNTVSGVLPAEGMELKLYYTRINYPYEVRYLEQGSGKQLATPKTSKAPYNSIVSETAIDITNYTVVQPETQSLNIRIEASQQTAAINIITFYYTENEVTINYVAKTEAGGTVTNSPEVLKVVSGVSIGSTATAKAGYTFKGWYSDEACTKKVSDSAYFVPAKDSNDLNVAATYYALFEEKSVTINYVAETGGSVNLASETLLMATGTAAGSTATAANGYTFIGWYNEAGEKVGTEAHFTPAKVNDLNVAATYTAKFEENKATIYYAVVDNVGGTVNPTSETLKVVTGTATGSTATAAAGYKFVGWYADSKGTGTCLSTDATYKPTKAEGALWVDGTTYYAKFEENKATIHYAVVGNVGGTVDPTSETLNVVTGTAAGSTATAVAGYKFVGWYADSAGAGTCLSTDATYKPTKAEGALWVDGTTYYAKFEELEATINYVAVGPDGATNFGSVDPATETVDMATGTAQGSTAKANTPTFKFVGWYADATCTGEPLSTDAKFVPTKNANELWPEETTYYAKFEYDVGDLKITKTVVDNNSVDTNVARSFTFTVTGEGVTEQIVINLAAGESTASATISNLVNGKYTVTETAVNGYKANALSQDVTVPAGSSAEVTFTNTVVTTDVTVTKTWVDNDDQLKLRPASITVNLLRNGEKLMSQTVTSAMNWVHTWSNLPTYSADGNTAYTYTVTEDAVDNYTTTVDGYNITNAIHVGQLIIDKTVVDTNNIYTGTDRTFTFTVKDVAGNIVKNGDSDTWSITVKANDDDGKEQQIVGFLPVGTYTVTEAAYNGYKVDEGEVEKTIAVNAGETATASFINTLETTNVYVDKVWVDKNNYYGLRPASIMVNLLRNDEELMSQAVTSDMNWTYTWTNLPTYSADGETAYTYTVTENEVAHYTTTYAEVEGGIQITNTIRTTSLTIEKSGLNTALDENQSALFNVTITRGNTTVANLTIAIKGNGSKTIVDLVEGDVVTVSEIDAWTWRYTSDGTKTITLRYDEANEVTINNTRNNEYWLDGDCYKQNVFGTN